MHVLTTDLDRTLLFSARSLGQPLQEALCVEELDGKQISYMNPTIWQLLQQAMRQHLFIPVTSRRLEQYARIQWPEQPQIAIVANGGIILRNGQVDAQWAQHIATQMQHVASIQTITTVLTEYTYTIYDELYAVCKNEAKSVPAPLQAQLEQHGWHAVQNGRKLYVLPRFLTKELAVKYVLATLPYTRHVAAGDSIMDVPMLRLAAEPFAPKDSEAATLYPSAAKPTAGLYFAEQLLRALLQ